MEVEALVEQMAGADGREAFIWRDTPYSYIWLLARLTHWAHAFERARIHRGTVLGLLSEMTPDGIAALLAAFRAACVVVPIVPSEHPDWRDLLRLARAQRSVRIGADGASECDELDGDGDHALYAQLRERGAPGLVLFSSGTTGTRKAAVHDVTRLLEKFKTRRHDLRTLVFMDFDHIGGQDTLLYALSNGSCLVLQDDISPEAVCRTIARHRVEVLPTAPTFLSLLALTRAYEGHDLTSIKYVTYGSELMSETVLQQTRRIFPQAKLLQKYGTTEVGTLRSSSRSSDSLWVRVGGEGYRTRVVDGMLEIQAASAMLGYLNAPSPFTDDGWFVTRDCVDVDGEFVRFRGRESDIINVGGRKVFPGDVEAVIRELPEVADVRVFPQANPIVGQIVCASVLPTPVGDPRTLKALVKRHCIAHLPSHQVPVVVQVRDAADVPSAS